MKKNGEIDNHEIWIRKRIRKKGRGLDELVVGLGHGCRRREEEDEEERKRK